MILVIHWLLPDWVKICEIVSMLTQETNMVNMVNIPAKYDRISIASTKIHI